MIEPARRRPSQRERRRVVPFHAVLMHRARPAGRLGGEMALVALIGLRILRRQRLSCVAGVGLSAADRHGALRL